MKKIMLLLSCAAFALLLLPDAAAQEDITQPKKFENASWYSAYHVKFKPGMREDGLNIIREHFRPIDKKLSAGSVVFLYRTGEWDVVAFFPLKEGPSSLAWQISPEDAEWNKALVEQEGSTEAAMEVFKEWSDTVAHAKTELAMQPAEF